MHIWGRLEDASAKIVCFKKCYENKKKDRYISPNSKS